MKVTDPVVLLLLACLAFLWAYSLYRIHARDKAHKNDRRKGDRRGALFKRKVVEEEVVVPAPVEELPKEDRYKSKREYMHRHLTRYMEAVQQCRADNLAGNRSLMTFSESILDHTAQQIKVYLHEARDKKTAYAHYPVYSRILMRIACSEILAYTEGKGLQEITKQLLEFSEKYLNLTNLNNIMNRHRGEIDYTTRCFEMSKAILEFHCIHIQPDVFENGMLPYDYIHEDAMMAWNKFHAAFYERAIDAGYTVAMKHAERVTYESEVRNVSQEYRKKRRQAKRRDSKQHRKARR